MAKAKELLGVPFAATPVRQHGLPHPTEAKQATNCAGVIIYALRRSGYFMPYLSAKGLQIELEKRGWRLAPGTPVRTGDILHFGLQSAILAEDRYPFGVLSDDDQILHAYIYGRVRLEAWKDLPYREQRVTIYRMNDHRLKPVVSGYGLKPDYTREQMS